MFTNLKLVNNYGKVLIKLIIISSSIKTLSIQHFKNIIWEPKNYSLVKIDICNKQLDFLAIDTR